jgi:hypothetical protein
VKTLLPAAVVLSLLSAPLFAAEPPAHDPYESVHSIQLGNGLKAVLAPSPDAKTFQIKVHVDAGHYNDEPGKSGVAHLLEHYLFTDAKLEKDMTYLEAIKEKGGSANAMTYTKETNYFATLPAKLASTPKVRSISRSAAPLRSIFSSKPCSESGPNSRARRMRGKPNSEFASRSSRSRHRGSTRTA